LLPTKITKNIIAVTARPRHGLTTATFSIERETETTCLGKLDRKQKERGQGFMKCRWKVRGEIAALA